jgi:UDP-N-acetylglucosamine/UDP-N-acetylgalactosamine diphosphorylase
MTSAPPDLVHRLKLHRQEHLLVGWEELSTTERQSFVNQLAGCDFAEVEQLYARRAEPHTILPTSDRITPLPVESPETLTACRSQGQLALARGELAILVVAGGQGSRLGFDKPKGMYPVGPISGASLFQIHAEKILGLSRRFSKLVPFLIMTSPATHEDTENFFEENNYFGLYPEQVFLFQQGTMPAVDLTTGQLLLEKPGQLFLSPNGHGGTLTALADSGLLADLKQRGVKNIFYFQIDNPLVNVADLGFIGRHIETRADVSSKVVFKDRPEEKVGVLALVDGQCSIIEYSDMPAALTNLRDDSGQLVYRAGNPAIHLFRMDFLEQVATGAGRLSFHLARKKVPFYDPLTKQMVTPTVENALKFELFVFDALPMAQRPLAVSTLREEEFAPLKNATGSDSPETCRLLQINRVARWLESCGITVPRDSTGEVKFPLELSPLFAQDQQELASKVSPEFRIEGPTLLR